MRAALISPSTPRSTAVSQPPLGCSRWLGRRAAMLTELSASPGSAAPTRRKEWL